MPQSALQLDPRDNVVVALGAARRRRCCHVGWANLARLVELVPAKHKVAIVDLAPGDLIRLYGMVVGEATQAIPRGGRGSRLAILAAPCGRLHGGAPAGVVCVARCLGMGGAHLHGLSIALTGRWARVTTGWCCRWSFAKTATSTGCARLLKRSLAMAAHTTATAATYGNLVHKQASGNGHTADDAAPAQAERVFPNVDGIRFLTHQGGCGGTRQDAQALCGLLAGYIHHPNVAGATVLSLGCQNAQAKRAAG